VPAAAAGPAVRTGGGRDADGATRAYSSCATASTAGNSDCSRAGAVAVGPLHRVDQADAGGARRAQHRQAVVDEQAARRIEVLHLGQFAPELLLLLGRAEAMRAEAGVEVADHLGAGILDGKRGRMRIGHQHQALAHGTHAPRNSRAPGSQRMWWASTCLSAAMSSASSRLQ
jgi:hypothetical protein